MTIKELLIKCEPDLDVRIVRSGSKSIIMEAWDLLFDLSDQPDEKVCSITTDHEVLVIELFGKEDNK